MRNRRDVSGVYPAAVAGGILGFVELNRAGRYEVKPEAGKNMRHHTEARPRASADPRINRPAAHTWIKKYCTAHR
jgi:hypothetical protein